MIEFITKVFAQSADQIVGSVNNPLENTYGPFYGRENETGGFIGLFSNLLRLVFIAAGIYAFLNLIVAGYQFMSAGGDSKAVTAAWNRIWQSLIGLVIIVGSFALAALFGYLIFGKADYILRPIIYGP